MKDFLDELIEDRKSKDPDFAEQWTAAELRIELATLRKEAGLTQAEMATMLHVTQPRVVELERHPEKVSFGRILQYIHAAGGSFTFGRKGFPGPRDGAH